MKLTRLWTDPRWRKLTGEIGIVTMGVLIALAVGEIAEAVRWKLRVATSMHATMAELGDHRANVVQRRIYQDCVDNRLEQIGDVLTNAKRTGSLPRVDNVGRTGLRSFGSSAFEVAKSEGVPLHMSALEARRLAKAYEMTSDYRAFAEQERASWTTLQLLEGPGGPIDSNLLTVLLQAWVEAKQANHWIKLIGEQANDGLRDFGVPVGRIRTHRDRTEFIELARSAPLCKPMALEVPATG